MTVDAVKRVNEIIRPYDSGSKYGDVAGDGKLGDAEIRRRGGNGYEQLARAVVGAPPPVATELFSRLAPEAQTELFLRRVGTPSTRPNDDEAYRKAYPNGDIVILQNRLEDDRKAKEWTNLFGVSRWAIRNGFRLVFIPVARVEDIQHAVQSDRTKVIVLSGHGDRNGRIADAYGRLIPEDTFNTNVGKNLRQIVFSNCFSDQTQRRFASPRGVVETYWAGTTTDREFLNYMRSDRFDPTKYGENQY